MHHGQTSGQPLFCHKKEEIMCNGPLPPYGVPIRDAIVRGDLREMKKLRDSVKPALEELELAIRKLESGEE